MGSAARRPRRLDLAGGIPDGDGGGRDARPRGRTAARHRVRDRGFCDRAGNLGAIRDPPVAGRGGDRGRHLRHLPRARPRHRAATRRECAPLQHGLRHGDRLPACGGYRHRHDPPLVVGTSHVACGRRRHRRRRDPVHVEGAGMTDDRPSRVRISALVAITIALCPAPVHAHLNSTGMGPIYDGMMHFVVSPEDLIPALALALFAGLRGVRHGREALFVLPGAWLLGGLLGLMISSMNGHAALSAVWFLVLGGLLVANVKLSVRATTALAALVGLYHGCGNGSGMGQSTFAAAALMGMVCAVFVLVALGAAFVVQLRAEWARIAVRVAGSWIAASGLLLLGWAVRGG